MSESRPLRVLAAWGYESGTTGTRIEIDVWSVNRGEREDTDDAVERARGELGANVDVIDAAGNVAKVRYKGIDAVGYRYIDSDTKASQQAFAGAKRSAGGRRTDAGTFDDGWTSPDYAPDINSCVAHGEAEVIPAVRQDIRRSGALELASAIEGISREPTRDEDDEPTQERPFDGFKNAVRIYPQGGEEFEYSVDVTRDSMRRD